MTRCWIGVFLSERHGLLRSWLGDRPDLREAIGTWYAEALAPTGLIRPAQRGRFSIDEVESMMATRIMQDIKRQVAAGEARGEARGKARGKPEGMLDTIRQLALAGSLSIDAARSQVKALAKTHQITAAQAKRALTQLG